MRVALYPGSFDPITLGHLDVLGRALTVFDRVVVAVLANAAKAPRLPAGVRVEVITAAVRAAGLPADRVAVTTFEGLTIEAARVHGASTIVRGLRSASDFEAELQLAQNNRRLAPELDTVCFITAPEHASIRSSLVREIAALGGDVSGMVPPAAVDALRGPAAGR
ncbi:MAG TPA: pantetheine-phosphate adenylyltransferase [Candidatus Limnocylindrales bacterium]|jgi:pantetheine-phosphate adenylyltransferase